VTGVTGSLGAHVVANLVSQSSVHKVYCLVRAPNKQFARHRVRDSLRERLAYHTLSLSTKSKIVALPSNFGEANLGLEQSDYDEVSNSITHLIHLAWSVNFNKGLESFEGDCIAGAKNLMNLCLAAKRPEPASFNFCSSVSATAATPGNVVPEALPATLSYAQGMGYAQSKLVTEHLCDRASQQTSLKARVLRVGQIIGDTQHGVWNAIEAIPLMLQTANTIGALPELDETPYWLPVDTVAKACSEIACSGAESGVMNIVNDKSFYWTRDLLPLLREAGLEFETVSQQEWIRRLRSSEADPVKNPPIKLVDFFASKYDNNKPRRSLAHATSRALGFSPSLQNASVIGKEIVTKIVAQLDKRWSAQQAQNEPAVIIVGGPCGSGKSTVARSLSDTINVPMIEGDDMHSRAARQRMADHVPLTDADRLSWLAHIRGAVMDRLRSTKAPAVLVTCSALRSLYRQELRMLQEIAGARTVFIMLETDSREELKTRLSERQGHYMAPAMVDAQVDLLEVAGDDEIDVVAVNATRSLDEVIHECRSIIAGIVCY
jgi:carbohydrate kinase (thermoresistant glucokinase family)